MPHRVSAYYQTTEHVVDQVVALLDSEVRICIEFSIGELAGYVFTTQSYFKKESKARCVELDWIQGEDFQKGMDTMHTIRKHALQKFGLLGNKEKKGGGLRIFIPGGSKQEVVEPAHQIKIVHPFRQLIASYGVKRSYTITNVEHPDLFVHHLFYSHLLLRVSGWIWGKDSCEWYFRLLDEEDVYQKMYGLKRNIRETKPHREPREEGEQDLVLNHKSLEFIKSPTSIFFYEIWCDHVDAHYFKGVRIQIFQEGTYGKSILQSLENQCHAMFKPYSAVKFFHSSTPSSSTPQSGRSEISHINSPRSHSNSCHSSGSPTGTPRTSFEQKSSFEKIKKKHSKLNLIEELTSDFFEKMGTTAKNEEEK